MTNQVQDLRDTIRKAITSQRSKIVTPLSSLLAVEDAIGYVPREAVEEVAKLTESTVNDVWGVASFYTNFRFTPPAEHTVEVCWGPSCHVLGAPSVLKAILGHLKLTTEGEAADGGITFKYNTCLGACAQAPVMSIDHHLVGRVKAEEALKWVRRLHEESGAGAVRHIGSHGRDEDA
ncbi:MAG: NAD(P)H-dependent oxidoreductase subunit E [Chloroflexi bacterium]|nr:NAD(P)H-dependent oxidoreductase subunit E [Chloroflexota bacterium]